LLISPSPTYSQGGGRNLDFANDGQAAQITIYDGPIGVSTTGKPIELGDFDGNGCGDIAITGQNGRGGNGQVRILFDICEAWGQNFDLFTPATVTLPLANLWGAAPGDMFGTEVYQSDFNQDGYADLAISAQNANFPAQGRAKAGAVYLIFGRPDLADLGTLDLQYGTQGQGILTIYGGASEDRLGMWVEGGDFDGDGYPDLLIGATQADGLEAARRPNAGEVIVIYGGPDMLGTYGEVVDMNEFSRPADSTLIIGRDADDLLGSTVFGEDFDGDGLADIIASAALWRGSAGVGGLAIGGADGPQNERYNAGEVYLIFGRPDLRGAVIDLQQKFDLTGAPADDSLSVIYGESARDVMGEEIALGDINGDGWLDVAIGSLATGGPDGSRPDGGEAWLIYGSAALRGQTFDLARSGVGVPIYAAEGDSKGGDTMLITDVDGDGFGDLIYGMPNADVLGAGGELRQNAGVLAVLYGGPEGLATTNGAIDFAALPPDLRVDFWLGVDQFDMAVYAMSLGDVDGDGRPEIAVNAMNSDGPDNRRPDSGEVYIINPALLNQLGPSVSTLAVGSGPVALPRVAEDGPAPTPAADTANPLGEQLYISNCAGCHGLDGRGINGIAVGLVDSLYLKPAETSEAELVAFLKAGRTADDPNSLMGRAMPAYGGNPALTDEDLRAIIAHIRVLQ
jgi:mono/diheme cytochrome c family protein